MNEEWRPVIGYEGYYEVSNLGRIKNVGYYHKSRHDCLLKVQPHTSGYQQIVLYKQNRGKSWYIHQLVAAAFIGPCPEGQEVNHKDTMKANNLDSNLEYKTRKENIHHAIENGRFVFRPKGVPSTTKSGKLAVVQYPVAS